MCADRLLILIREISFLWEAELTRLVHLDTQLSDTSAPCLHPIVPQIWFSVVAWMSETNGFLLLCLDNQTGFELGFSINGTLTHNNDVRSSVTAVLCGRTTGRTIICRQMSDYQVAPIHRSWQKSGQTALQENLIWEKSDLTLSEHNVCSNSPERWPVCYNSFCLAGYWYVFLKRLVTYWNSFCKPWKRRVNYQKHQ